MAGTRGIQKEPDAAGLRIALVASRFNGAVVDGLIEGARSALLRMGADSEAIDLVRVPGAWELPVAAQRVASSGPVDAVIALGAVIRGETPHFDYVAGQCATGLAAVALTLDMPVAFGVLTCDTQEQARARSAGDDRNKGAEAAVAAVEMAQLFRELES